VEGELNAHPKNNCVTRLRRLARDDVPVGITLGSLRTAEGSSTISSPTQAAVAASTDAIDGAKGVGGDIAPGRPNGSLGKKLCALGEGIPGNKHAGAQ